MPQYKTTALVRRKRFRMYLRMILSVIFVAAIVFGTHLGSNAASVQIETVNISGNKYLTSDFVRNIFDELTSDKLFYLIGQKNIVFLPREQLAKRLEQELPVDRAYVRMRGLREVSIEIVEHEPWGIWCKAGAAVAGSGNNDCYLVNKDGLLFVGAPGFIIENLIKLESKIEGEVLGAYYVEKNVFNRLVLIEKLLHQINISIAEIKTDDLETFILKTKNGPNLLVDDNDDPLEVANNLKTTLEQESIHKIQFSNLEYVDLRFAGKAYYKIK